MIPLQSLFMSVKPSPMPLDTLPMLQSVPHIIIITLYKFIKFYNMQEMYWVTLKMKHCIGSEE